MLFFFKQKTAYEMRISDWSSDVCSSDLSRKYRIRPCSWLVCRCRWAMSQASRPAVHNAGRVKSASRQARLPMMCPECPGDLKSDVQGQSVSVRVDLGGRRVINKKKFSISQIMNIQYH